MLTTYEEAPDMTPSRRAPALAAAVAASGALLLAGCGGSPTSTTKTGGGTAAGSPAGSAGGDSGAPSPSAGVAADAARFARCIRAHGVSDFPDPSSSGQLTIPPDDRNTPAFKSASKACQSLMPGGAGGSGQTSTMSRAQQLRVARCMRSHGVPNFPDANASGELSLNGIDQNSPAYRAALRECLPARGPAPPG